jgi:hypothetical protein
MTKFFIIFLFVLFSGCASTPSALVNVNDSKYFSNLPKTVVSEIKISNNTSVSKGTFNLISDSKVTLPYKPTALQVVEEDLHDLFSQRTLLDSNANKLIYINIERADAYWIHGGVDKIPFLSILTVTTNQKYVFNVKITIEVETNGKVISAYTIDEEVEYIAPGAWSTDGEKQNYSNLIKEYREKILKKIDDRFISRYL